MGIHDSKQIKLKSKDEDMMTRQDLKDYKYNKEWIKNQVEWVREQQQTINKLTSIIQDMPRRKELYI